MELLDDHLDALKAKKGEVVDLLQEMGSLSATGKTTTEEISQLKVDLCREVTAHSSQEEELARVRQKLGKKGLEMLEKDFVLQQKESALLAAQQALEEMRQRAERAEATLRSE